MWADPQMQCPASESKSLGGRAVSRRRSRSLLPGHISVLTATVTHPGLERYELEDHLQGEDDGEGYVENVRDVVHLFRLVVMLEKQHGRAGPGGQTYQLQLTIPDASPPRAAPTVCP